MGVLLFLFIPLVLFLFVRHPEPVGMSLIAGVLLMVGHRRLARPYMERVLPVKCVWCNRMLPAGEGEALELRSGDDPAAHGDARAEYEQFYALGVDAVFSDFPDVASQVRLSA